MSKIEKINTHPGIFHADDIMAVAFLSLKNPGVPVERRVPTAEELADPTVACVDVGGQYDWKLQNYDHHQKGGAGARWDSEIKYAAFGLVMSHQPHQNELVNAYLDEHLVCPVDALDNGQRDEPAPGAIPTLSFSKAVSSFNPVGNVTPLGRELTFKAALEIGKQVLSNFVGMAENWAEARAVVEAAKVENHVMVLEKFVPWQEHLFGRADEAEILYVVYPSERGGYCVQQVPKTASSFEGRKPLPAAWAGLRGAEFLGVALPSQCTPATDAWFCHPGRFICGAQTLGDALRLAEIAVNTP
jgi:uncharacterized UPF0160 family protein